MKLFSLLSLCTIIGVTAANSSTPKVVRSIKGAESSSRQLSGDDGNYASNYSSSNGYSSYGGSSGGGGSHPSKPKPPAKKTKKPKAKPHKKTSSHSSSSSSSGGYSGYSEGYGYANGYTKKSLYSYSAVGVLGLVSAAAAVLAKKGKCCCIKQEEETATIDSNDILQGDYELTHMDSNVSMRSMDSTGISMSSVELPESDRGMVV